jgi:hypothetical protein
MDARAWYEVGALFALTAVVGLGLWRARRDVREQALRSLEGRLSRRGPWVGAFFMSIPAHRRADIIRDAMTAARAGQGPARVFALWRQAGARVVAHGPGRAVGSRREALQWLREMSADIEQAPPPAPDGEALFALLYASSEPPPAGVRQLSEIEPFLSSDACVGMSFLPCATKTAQLSPMLGLRARMLAGAFVICLLATGAALAMALFQRTPEAPSITREAAPRSHFESSVPTVPMPVPSTSQAPPPPAVQEPCEASTPASASASPASIAADAGPPSTAEARDAGGPKAKPHASAPDGGKPEAHKKPEGVQGKAQP